MSRSERVAATLSRTLAAFEQVSGTQFGVNTLHTVQVAHIFGSTFIIVLDPLRFKVSGASEVTKCGNLTLEVARRSTS